MESWRRYASSMSRELALVVIAIVFVATSIGAATAYPSHAYQTATPMSVAHTYCSTVRAFEAVSSPWKVDRRWSVRAGILGAGLVLGIGSLAAARALNTSRQRSAG
jgi:hypothetical protein